MIKGSHGCPNRDEITSMRRRSTLSERFCASIGFFFFLILSAFSDPPSPPRRGGASAVLPAKSFRIEAGGTNCGVDDEEKKADLDAAELLKTQPARVTDPATETSDLPLTNSDVWFCNHIFRFLLDAKARDMKDRQHNSFRTYPDSFLSCSPMQKACALECFFLDAKKVSLAPSRVTNPNGLGGPTAVAQQDVFEGVETGANAAVFPIKTLEQLKFRAQSVIRQEMQQQQVRARFTAGAPNEMDSSSKEMWPTNLHPKTYQMFDDPLFNFAYEAYHAACELSLNSGKDQKTKKARALTSEEQNKILNDDEMSPTNPEVMQFTQIEINLLLIN